MFINCCNGIETIKFKQGFMLLHQSNTSDYSGGFEGFREKQMMMMMMMMMMMIIYCNWVVTRWQWRQHTFFSPRISNYFRCSPILS